MIKAEFFGNISVAYYNFFGLESPFMLIDNFQNAWERIFSPTQIFSKMWHFFAHWLQIFHLQFCGCLMDVDSTEAGFFAEQYATLFWLATVKGGCRWIRYGACVHIWHCFKLQQLQSVRPLALTTIPSLQHGTLPLTSQPSDTWKRGRPLLSALSKYMVFRHSDSKLHLRGAVDVCLYSGST